ncbi:RluA family pseudouridine synthase [Cardinium endosymbiont of Culicoides punctatus]|uniref:RluA family pseudouridine synthase n=1 Tax=Cardinium endosymbiont of Culicoides punctatus TaxID=2304601 RepID=UPI001058A213|nr:RluA family pseudouridine synthase [Cardinium endosymbiont of Culicoides punctatus]TDG95671.1 Ribosomal large subunit pseudouridine synthase D [Cardinium endosymbiont of Culicoides punctatus]
MHHHNGFNPTSSYVLSDAHTTYKEYCITVTEEICNRRIDKFLSEILHISRNKIQEAIERQLITANNHIIKGNYVVHVGDNIHAKLPVPIDMDVLIPEDIPLNLVYEDDHLLVINKPAQVVVHPDATYRIGTVANALCYRYQNLPLKDNMPTRPGLVHRIDKDTSGLLVIAKTAEGLKSLADQFYHHTVERTYYLLVWGSLTDDAGTIDVHIGRNSHDRKIILTFTDNQQGKRAVTHYQVMKRFHHVTLLTCKLETGRTHQIRVHMKHIGHPIFGDLLYGGNIIVSGQWHASYKAFVQNCFKIMPHQALHAATLGFQHPITNESMFFEAPLPENFVRLVHKWEKYMATRLF